ncbi:MAG TPA: DJ-1 family glyoxalase III [Nitrospirales bacterium]|jgi:4-methyl-5(b-hydroxyethyl)-thiazole monophosphate biosynthesis
MKRVLVPLAHGFEEIETVTIVDILRRAGAQVMMASVETEAPPAGIEGRSGIKVMPDRALSEMQGADFDMIVLPGGLKGAQTLQKDPHVARLLRDAQKEGRYIGAICAAPIVLAANNMIAGRRLTSHPSVKEQLDGAMYDDGRVVIDGRLVTSRGPGTALEFAMVLVELLEGKEKKEEIKEAVLAAG